jgi:hypothetical protein
MKKQIRALLEIAIIYLAVSIVLDYILAGFQILLWPALGVAFILFAIMIFGVLWEQRDRMNVANEVGSSGDENDLARLERLGSAAVDQGETRDGEAISERIRSIAYAAAAYRLNESEVRLKTMVEREPNVLRSKIGDERIFHALTTRGSLTRKGDWRSLNEYLRSIEDWAK